MQFNGPIGVSFLIPAPNEAATIGEVLERIDALGLDAENITWRDGFRAILVLVAVRLRRG